MKLYIKSYSSYIGDIKEFDVKRELKQKYKLDTRRQDTFIHLAVYGAQRLKESTNIDLNDELYITSGVGNIDVLQKTNNYVGKEGHFIKPFDFINMLGNTTSYYVASSLDLKGKNTFQISDNFTYINTLISIFASINISKNDAILGSIDLATEPDEIIKRVLGIDQSTKVTSSVNYQKLSLDKYNAVGYIEFEPKSYTLDEVKEMIDGTDLNIICSMRCNDLKAQKYDEYFETAPSYAVSQAVESKIDTIYVDYYDSKYKILKLINI